MNKFIDIVRKISLIASTQASLKKNFKKYVVDTFYNRIIISGEFNVSEVKNELNKLINLSKEEVSFLGVKFELKQNYIKSITYEMLYFYVEELYELIKKWLYFLILYIISIWMRSFRGSLCLYFLKWCQKKLLNRSRPSQIVDRHVHTKSHPHLLTF